MDLRQLGKEKFDSTEIVIDNFGLQDDTIVPPKAVQQQTQSIIDQTLTPVARESEVTATETPVTVPTIVKKQLEREESHNERQKRTKGDPLDSFKTDITRSPNRWTSNCNRVVNNTDPPGLLWTARKGIAQVSVYNHTDNSNNIYVAPSQSDLVSGKGKLIAPGDSWSISVEEAGWVLAETGAAIVDVIVTFYELER